MPASSSNHPVTEAFSRKLSRGDMLVLPAFVLVLLGTRAVELGDTQVYANDIVANLGKSPFFNGNPLWEFGHLLWRPLGWALLQVISPLLSSMTDWTPFMQASFVLIAVSTLCSIASVVLWYFLSLAASGSRSVAFLVTLGTAFSHGFLLYSHSGCSYIPGLACLSAAMYLAMRNRLMAAGVCYGVAVLFWFPFILAGAALIFAAPGLARGSDSSAHVFTVDWRRTASFVAISGAVIVLGYGLALAAARITSIAEAKDWYSRANHGYSPGAKLVRAATGLPRSFMNLGKDGILYRRYLRHDPYALVSMRDIAAASLWKLFAFYLFVGCLLYELWRQRNADNRPFLMLAASSVPVLLFAVFIFEPGSPERYLPFLPFLLFSVAWVLRNAKHERRPAQLAIAAFLLCVIVSNGYSFSAPRVAAENESISARIGELRPHLRGASMVMITTNQDPLEEMVNRSAFGQINRPEPLRVYDVVEPGTSKMVNWKHDLAQRVLDVWQARGEVWASKRFWASKPLPEWNWVEGDDPRARWEELPAIFGSLSTDQDYGGPDGFSRLAPNPANYAILTRMAASTLPDRSPAH